MSEGEDRTRENSELQFRCFVQGEDLRARILRFYTDGAIISTQRPLSPGDVVLVYPFVGQSEALPMVLLASIVSLLGITGPAYSMQWLKCITQKGYDSLFDMLTGYMGLDPSTLAPADQQTISSPNVGFDFLGRKFYVPRRKKDPRERASPMASAFKTGTAEVRKSTGSLRPPSSPPSNTGTTQEPSSTSYSVTTEITEITGRIPQRHEEPTRITGQVYPETGVRAGGAEPSDTAYSVSGGREKSEVIVSAGRSATGRIPIVAPTNGPPQVGSPTAQASSRALPGAMETTKVVGEKRVSTEGPTVSRLLIRDKSRVPVELQVRYKLNGKKDDGLIRALGTKSLFLATGLDVGPAEGVVHISLPVPNQREPTVLQLVCRVDRVEDGAQLGYQGMDLTITHLDEGKRPGLFVRYIKTLYYKMTRQSK